MLHTAELENQYLKRDIQKWPEDFRVSTANSHQIVNEATLVLEKLKSSLSYSLFGCNSSRLRNLATSLHC
jgi:hypothetical protein